MIIGHTSPFETSSNHAPSYLLGSPIVVPALSTIDAFGIIARRKSRIVVALYTSSPMTLVVATEPADLDIGEQTIRPTIHPTIEPGTYWLLAVFERHASVGYDMTDKTSPVRHIRHDFRDPLPEHIEKFTSYTGQRFNFWLVTE
jgi:hypothetical protein